VGGAVRLALAPLLSHTFDVYARYVTAMDIFRMPIAHVPFPSMPYYTFVPLAYLYSFLSDIFGFQPYPMVDIPPELNPYPQFRIAYVTDPVLIMAALRYVPHLSVGSALAATLGTEFSLMVITLLEILPERRRMILATVFGEFTKRCKTIARTRSSGDTAHGNQWNEPA
jgi:hypothetical protein